MTTRISPIQKVKLQMVNRNHLAKSLQDVIKREDFDPDNKDHRMAYKLFKERNAWSIHFNLEVGYSSIQAMVEQKLLDWSLKDL